MTNDNMTGAELQTLREGLHLTRDDLAGLAGVQARTVKHWENGRSGVPDDVASMVQRLDMLATLAAREVIDTLTASTGKNGAKVLYRYRSAEDFSRYEPSLNKIMPVSVHAATVARAQLGLQLLAPDPARAVQIVRVVWFDVAGFEAWRSANQQPNTQATRQQWAAQALPAQAMPHRADQPPA